REWWYRLEHAELRRPQHRAERWRGEDLYEPAHCLERSDRQRRQPERLEWERFDDERDGDFWRPPDCFERLHGRLGLGDDLTVLGGGRGEEQRERCAQFGYGRSRLERCVRGSPGR